MLVPNGKLKENSETPSVVDREDVWTVLCICMSIYLLLNTQLDWRSTKSTRPHTIHGICVRNRPNSCDKVDCQRLHKNAVPLLMPYTWIRNHTDVYSLRMFKEPVFGINCFKSIKQTRVKWTWCKSALDKIQLYPSFVLEFKYYQEISFQMPSPGI